MLDNALRHTPAGGQIRLAARPEGREVCISVTDTGCGIAPEHLPPIFERFYRADPARGRAGGNAGLGLSIAQGIVKLMGGQIGAESAIGQGTTIWLRFAAACARRAAAFFPAHRLPAAVGHGEGGGRGRACRRCSSRAGSPEARARLAGVHVV